MHFKVALDRLTSVSAQIEDLASRLDQVGQSAVAYAGHADAQPVEDAMQGFFAHWEHGMAQLHQQLSDLANHLDQARSAYTENEQKLVNGARGDGP